MSSTQALAGGMPVPVNRGEPPWRGRRLGLEFRWAIAFVLPYAAVFLAFVVYPFGYALWMAGKPSLYAELFADPLYLPTVVNTLLFVGLGVNLKMFLALLLSGFFLRRRWWIRALLAVYILPWADRGGPSLRLVPLDADHPAGVWSTKFCSRYSASTARTGLATAGWRSDQTSSPIPGSGCRSGP